MLPSLLGQLLPRTSVLGAVLVMLLIAGILLGFIYLKSRIEAGRQEAERLIQARLQEDSVKASAQQVLLSEVHETRQQLIELIKQGHRERNRGTRTLGSLCAEARATAKTLDSLRLIVEAMKEEIIRLEGKRRE